MDSDIEDQVLAGNKAEMFAKFGYWTLDISKGEIYASPGARKIYGTSKIYFTLEEIKVFRLEAYHQILDSSLQDLVEKGLPYNLEFEIKKEDTGEIIFVRSSAEFDQKNNIVFGVLVDINDQKKAELELIANKARMEGLLRISQYKATSIQSFLDYALSEAILLTKSKFGYIYFYNEEKQLFKLNTWSNGVMPECKVVEVNTEYELGKTGLWGEAVRQRKPILENDYAQNNPFKKGYPEGHVHLKNFLTIPVFQGEEIVAVVGVANKESNYLQADVHQLNLMMDWVWNIVKGLEKDIKLRQLSQAVEQSPTSIILTDLSGSIVYANPAFSDVSGYSNSEVLGQNPRVLKSGYTKEKEYKNLWETITGGQSWHGEFHNKTKSGNLYWESAIISPIKNEQGEIINFLAIKSDITAMKNSQQTLKNSEARYRSVSQTANDAIVTIDDKGFIVDWNLGAERLFGYLEIEAKGRSVDIIIPKEYLKNHMKFLTEKQGGISGKIFEKPIEGFGVNKEKVPIPVELSLSKWETEEGVFYTSIIRDITERKAAEQHRDAITNDLIKQNKALQQFTYIVSHNLRAPVANIIGLNQIMADPDLTPSEKIEISLGLEKSVTNLDNVIKDMSHILHLKQAIDGNKEEIKFIEIVESISESLAPEIKNSQARILSDFSEVKGTLSIKSYWVSIFQNLIANSIKYRKLEIPPIIDIKSEKTATGFRVIFQDNCLGFNLNRDHEKVFGLYKRFHPNKAEGSGVGLFMVKTQVEALKGTITLESQENLGSKFTLTFEQ
jgi:PAS domain S-box-containing protein